MIFRSTTGSRSEFSAAVVGDETRVISVTDDYATITWAVQILKLRSSNVLFITAETPSELFPSLLWMHYNWEKVWIDRQGSFSITPYYLQTIFCGIILVVSEVCSL